MFTLFIAIASLTLVAAQPPLPPPGVSPVCNATLTNMHRQMQQSWLQYRAYNRGCLKRCIPNDGRLTPPVGKICRAQCVPPTQSWVKDYISKCNTQQGKASFKDIDLVWNVPSTCGIFHKGECVMSTSMISCMPLKCSPSDIVLLAEAETEAFCPSMKAYNLSSCAIKFVEPK